MNLKWKPTQISLELSRRLFGPDRAEVAKRSNNVGPDVDDAIHKCADGSTDYRHRHDPEPPDCPSEGLSEFQQPGFIKIEIGVLWLSTAKKLNFARLASSSSAAAVLQTR